MMTGTPDSTYEVLIVKYGTRAAQRDEVFLNYAIYGVPDEPIGMDYFVWIARNSARTVVLDTGYSVAGGTKRGRTTLISPPDAFAALGVPTTAATTVVLSHAHYDHAGNLDAFPQSELVMAASEREFWSGPLAARRQFSHSTEIDDLEQIDLAARTGRLRTFTGSMQLAPGIELIEVGGHTDGQLVMIVQTSDGPVLLASDSVHYYDELERDMPFTYVSNLPDMYRGFDRISEMAATGQIAHIVPGHDPSTLSRFGAYQDALPGLVSVIGKRS